ncbi:ABC transporter substrate-binding protein [Desulfovibrio inopinatus]|uniref:ABC transporter substrate-binding protein n=1 Tax=Desulfovibrio inopinatus TaxID=102109 RepID=UPI0004040F54|nr:extracellular solute-binding protein [Desulfovibrio inopinatus]
MGIRGLLWRHSLFIILFLMCCTPGQLFAKSWWTQAAEPYEGITLRGISESTTSSRYVKDVLCKKFEDETGIKVELELLPWTDMHDRSIQDMATNTGVYDFVYVEQDIISAYLKQQYLVDLTVALDNNARLRAPDFSFDNFTSFLDYFRDVQKGHVYAIPMESFLKVLVYQKQLFEDPTIQAAFVKEYGYALAPPETPAQYRDIAAFFTAWGKQHGLELWGSTQQASLEHPAAFYELVESIFPMFGLYNWGINPKTLRASQVNGGTLNSELAKKAFRFWLDMLQYSPPEAYGSTWDETVLTYASGRAAMMLIYTENLPWIATDPIRSKIVGNIGIALPPLVPGVLKNAEQGKGYIGYYDGGAFGLPKDSRNQEATLLWLQYIGRPELQVDWALNSGRVVHRATLDDPQVKAQDKRFGGYFTLLQKYGDLFAGAPPFEFHAAVRDVISPYITMAIRKELTPEEALDQAAVAVDTTLQEMGYGSHS